LAILYVALIIYSILGSLGDTTEIFELALMFGLSQTFGRMLCCYWAWNKHSGRLLFAIQLLSQCIVSAVAFAAASPMVIKVSVVVIGICYGLTWTLFYVVVGDDSTSYRVPPVHHHQFAYLLCMSTNFVCVDVFSVIESKG
jgi:hypothetical protein